MEYEIGDPSKPLILSGPARRTEIPQSRILALDDDPGALQYVRGTLSRAGHTPIVTANPGDLKGLIEAHRPNVVLMDLMLPGADGGSGDFPVLLPEEVWLESDKSQSAVWS